VGLCVPQHAACGGDATVSCEQASAGAGGGRSAG
jgi:hypothetical protein